MINKFRLKFSHPGKPPIPTWSLLQPRYSLTCLTTDNHCHFSCQSSSAPHFTAGHAYSKLDHLRRGETLREHHGLGAALLRHDASNSSARRRSGRGPVAHMAKRGESGIGEREHARVYPNARSEAAAASKTNARGLFWWCHLLRKSFCFSMCAGSAYWCHFPAKS